MSLHILMGEAGSGKSQILLEEMVRHAVSHPDRHHIVLVPEQFTFETQRRILAELEKSCGKRAFMNIEALSFAHLANRADKVPGTEKPALLTDTGKSLLLTMALKAASPELEIYRRQTGRAGFIKRLGSLFAEWQMNGLGPERIRELSGEESFTPLLAGKLRELSLIYGHFLRLLGASRMTAEQKLPRLAALLPQTSLAEGAYLYLDGFTGFTSVEYTILEEMFKRCPEIWAALTLPEEEASLPAGEADGGLFALSRRTLRKLAVTAEHAGQKCERHYIRRSFPAPADLDYLGKHILRLDGCAPYPQKPEHITDISCAGAGEEARFTAARIRALTRGGSLRYRDIAVVTSDPETYLPVLERELEHAGIPYFSDRRDPINRHPFIRLLEAALEIGAGQIGRDSLLRFMKTSLSPLDRDACDILENYILAAGLKGGRHFTEEFTRLPKKGSFDLEQLNLWRSELITPFVTLREALKRGRTAADYRDALLIFEDSLGLPERLEAEAARLETEGETREAEAWRKICGKAAEVIGECADILGDTTLSPAEYRDLMAGGFDSLSLGLIPSGTDQIILGDAWRSRFGNIRVLFFLGLNEGLVPKSRGGSRILTDRERTELAEVEPELGYTDERAFSEEQFSLYNLFSKATEQLILLSSRSDADDKPSAVSPVLREIRALFPAGRPEQFSELPIGRQVAGADSARMALAGYLGRPEKWKELADKEGSWEDLYRLLVRGEGAARTERIGDGLFYRLAQKRLTPEEAAALYGRKLETSVSRLESYAGCPYAYFLKYGLMLSERAQAEFSSADLGELYHNAMETLLRGIREDGARLAGMEREERLRRIRKAVGDTLDTLLKDQESAYYRYYAERWTSVIDRKLWAMGLFEDKVGFEPEVFEMDFEASGNSRLHIALSGGELVLRGRIDRIDLCREADRTYLRVVDYKSSERSYDVSRLWDGLQLQLTAYLVAAEECFARKEKGEVVPAGMYYNILRDPIVEKTGNPENALLSAQKLSGVTLEEAAGLSGDVRSGKEEKAPWQAHEIRTLEDFALLKMKQFGEEILNGVCGIAPRGKESCSFCPYAAVCRFDRKAPGSQYREACSMTRAEFLEKAKARIEEETAL